MWPAVAVLALVLGLAGGVAGSVVYNRTSDSVGSDGGGTGQGLNTARVQTAAPLKGGNGSVAAVAQELLPSTVQISAEYEGQEGGATGSGFVLDDAGHVITNNHVVEQAAEDDGPIEIVDQDGNRYDATVVGRSPVYDLAVLYVRGGQGAAARRARARRGRCASATRSSRSARRSGLSSTVTAGIVSALQPTGDHRRRRRRVVLHQRRPDRRRDQPGQLRRPAGQPARPGGRRQLRHRHHRRQPPAATRRATSASASRSRSSRSRSPPTRSCAPARPATR